MKRTHSEYHEEYYGTRKKSKPVFIFILGLFVIFSLFFLFNGYGRITGNAVGTITKNNSVEIKTSISVPEILLEGEYEGVNISFERGTKINFDDKTMVLNEKENNLILEGFEGKIKLKEGIISVLSGKASKITINNLPIHLQNGGRLKISLSESSKYNILQIKEKIHLDEISSTTSGTISVGGDSLNFNSEKIEIKNYFGILKIENNKLILEGLAEELNLLGKDRKIALSKK